MADELKTVAPGCPLDTYGEVPEWLKSLLFERLDELRNIADNQYSATSNRNAAKAQIYAIEWVLSLRKPENK